MSDRKGIWVNHVIEDGRQRLLLTSEEAAGVLGIGRTQVFALIARGELESVKIGRSRRIPVRACMDYVERLGREQR